MSRVSVVLATLGVAVFTLALAVPTRSTARTLEEPYTVTALEAIFVELAPIAETEPIVEPIVEPEQITVVALPASPAEPPAPLVPKPPPVAVLASANGPGAVVVASWYGPGFYGNRTACGQVYTAEIHGVAHRTLPCGTVLRLEFGGRSVAVPVIDRGPFIAGRTLDLSNATRAALGCTDLCPVWMQ